MEALDCGPNGLGSRTTDLYQLDRAAIPNNRDIWWMAQRTSAMKSGPDPW